MVKGKGRFPREKIVTFCRSWNGSIKHKPFRSEWWPMRSFGPPLSFIAMAWLSWPPIDGFSARPRSTR
jgi:hypothetical protein